MFRCVNPIRLDAISKTLSNEVCVKLSEFGLERQNDILHINDWIVCTNLLLQNYHQKKHFILS